MNTSAKFLAILNEVAANVLWNGLDSDLNKSQYVCNAINAASRNLYGKDAYYSDAVTSLRQEVSRRLNGAYTYDDYYAKRNGIDTDILDWNADLSGVLQAGRLALVNEMIASYQSELNDMQNRVKILTWVLEHRKDGRLVRDDGSKGSPYVCDCLGEYPGMYDGGIGSELYVAKEAIKQDIKEFINGKFGVAEYLHVPEADGDENYDPEVIAFRTSMIEGFIEKYSAA